MTPQRVAVIGAGAVGLCCAYYLRKQGIDVVVIDKGPAGHGCSYANGGWICPAQSGPLPEPGLIGYALRSFFDADSPLDLKLGALPALSPWLFSLCRHCNARSFRHGLEAIAQLGVSVFEQVDAVLADGVEFDIQRTGALVAGKDPVAVQARLDSLEPMRKYGYQLPRELIRGRELQELEPAVSTAITAGWILDEQVTVDPASFTRGLASWLTANGAAVLEGTEVIGFAGSSGTVRAARTPTGEIKADAFVLAAGVWSRAIARLLGVALPIVSGKGYSFFLRPTIVPGRALELLDLFVGATPFGGRVRIGGVLEFSGLNLRIDKRRIESMVRGAREALVEWASPDIEDVWAGGRPMTPDGLPIIDRLKPLSNVYVAAGHSFQGVSLALPTGKQLVDLITSGRTPDALNPFRFNTSRGPTSNSVRSS